MAYKAELKKNPVAGEVVANGLRILYTKNELIPTKDWSLIAIFK